jgi:hypothetical protein
MESKLLIYLGAILLSLLVIFYSIISYDIVSSLGIELGISREDKNLERLSDYMNFTTLKPVFSGNGPNCSVGFVMSDGYHKPGDRIGVTLDIYRPRYYHYNLVFVVKLFRIETRDYLMQLDNKTIDVRGIDTPVGVIGEVYFTLSMSEGVKYLLVVEAFEDDTVVDMIRSIIIVPIQIMNAGLFIDKKEYMQGEKLAYTIINLGEDPIIFGPCYQVYRWDGEKWVLDRELTPKMCPDLGITLYKGERRSFIVSLDKTEPGLYKIVVKVKGETTDKVKVLSQEFIIRP